MHKFLFECAVLHRGPCEAPAFRSLAQQYQSEAIPDEELQPVGTFRSEDENVAGKRVGRQRLLHRRAQAVHTTAESTSLSGFVALLRGDIYIYICNTSCVPEHHPDEAFHA